MQSSKHLKIITLNTWQERGPWQKRWKFILTKISKEKPDIVCFQEVFNEKWALDLAVKTGLGYFYYPEISSGLLTLSRYPIIESSFIRYKAKSPTESYNRFATYVRVKVPNHILSVFNTHLSWRPEDSRVRLGQTKELSDFVRDQGDQSDAFIMGDFNSVSDSSEIKYLLSRRLVDIYRYKNPNNPGITWNNANPFVAGSRHHLPDRRIDYLFGVFKKSVDVKNLTDCSMIFEQPDSSGVYASDHFGLIATLRINRRK